MCWTTTMAISGHAKPLRWRQRRFLPQLCAKWILWDITLPAASPSCCPRLDLPMRPGGRAPSGRVLRVQSFDATGTHDVHAECRHNTSHGKGRFHHAAQTSRSSPRCGGPSRRQSGLWVAGHAAVGAFLRDSGVVEEVVVSVSRGIDVAAGLREDFSFRVALASGANLCHSRSKVALLVQEGEQRRVMFAVRGRTLERSGRYRRRGQCRL